MMTGHEQFHDDLAMYALGELDEARQAEFRQHLSDCAACRREYQQMQDDFALLSLSVTGSAPPARSRDRLLSAIRKEPRMAATHLLHSRPRWWSLAPVFASVVLAAFAIMLWMEKNDLVDQIDALQRQNTISQHDLVQARELVATITSSESVSMTLTSTQAKPQPQIRVFYQKRNGRLLLFASDLQQLPPKKAYELWLIPANGGAAVAAGVFKPDARGSGSIVSPQLPENLEAKNFAITVEDEAGSPVATSPIIMMGQ